MEAVSGERTSQKSEIAAPLFLAPACCSRKTWNVELCSFRSSVHMYMYMLYMYVL